MEFLAYFLILWWACLELSPIGGAAFESYNYYGPPAPVPAPAPAPAPSPGTTLDVTKFGAVGDGKIDDSKAFETVWNAACQQVSNTVKISVPNGKTFLVSPIQFEGPCKSQNITFEILGTIVAQPKSAWKRKNSGQWLKFHRVDGLKVVGNEQGLIDGQGDSWWKKGGGDNARPTALRFSECNNLEVSGLKHINPPKFHVSITQCNNANISKLHIIAPELSPNTDGIDVGSSANIRIENCTMETGDDCIAIKGGSSNVTISGIYCGLGHGISIGSLGENGREDQVERIDVTNCTLNRTTNGLRIKTWQGGSGFARNINFMNISFIEANFPVIIDQFYCPHKTCQNKTSAVNVSDVRYMGLRGTAICKNPTISFQCSNTIPCTNILLEDINITSSYSDPVHNSPSVVCLNAYGSANGTCNPAVNCLSNKYS